jgi:hypothetical protein
MRQEVGLEEINFRYKVIHSKQLLRAATGKGYDVRLVRHGSQ